jgi:hypothetical protein
VTRTVHRSHCEERRLSRFVATALIVAVDVQPSSHGLHPRHRIASRVPKGASGCTESRLCHIALHGSPVGRWLADSRLAQTQPPALSAMPFISSRGRPGSPRVRWILAIPRIPAGSLWAVPRSSGRRLASLAAHAFDARKAVPKEPLAGGNANQHDVRDGGGAAVCRVAGRGLPPSLPAFRLLNVLWTCGGTGGANAPTSTSELP